MHHPRLNRTVSRWSTHNTKADHVSPIMVVCRDLRPRCKAVPLSIVISPFSTGLAALSGASASLFGITSKSSCREAPMMAVELHKMYLWFRAHFTSSGTSELDLISNIKSKVLDSKIASEGIAARPKYHVASGNRRFTVTYQPYSSKPIILV